MEVEGGTQVKCAGCGEPLDAATVGIVQEVVAHKGMLYHLTYLEHGCGAKTYVQVDNDRSKHLLAVLESQLVQRDRKAARKTNGQLDKLRKYLHGKLDGQIVTRQDMEQFVLRLAL